MIERGTSAAQPGEEPSRGEGDRRPPLAPELAGVGASYTWKYGEAGRPRPEEPAAGSGAGDEELERLRAQVRHLTGALEDVVALALSGADYKERAIMMHRRAVSALSGATPKQTPP